MSTKPCEEVLLVVWRTDNLFRHMVWAVFRYWYMCGSCLSVSDSLVWDQTLGTAKQPHLFSEAASHTTAEMAPWGSRLLVMDTEVTEVPALMRSGCRSCAS